MELTPEDARADAALRALFAEADRPPLGDNAFVAAVMGRVARERTKRAARLDAALAASVGLAVTAAAVNAGDLLGVAVDLAARYGADLPQVGIGAVSLVIAAAATGVGLAVSAR